MALQQRIVDDDVSLTYGIVSLNVRGQDGPEVCFNIRCDSPLKKLMDVYWNRADAEAEREGFRLPAFRFIFDGNRIVESRRPNDLEMEDDDVIDAMLEQVGD